MHTRPGPSHSTPGAIHSSRDDQDSPRVWLVALGRHMTSRGLTTVEVTSPYRQTFQKPRQPFPSQLPRPLELTGQVSSFRLEKCEGLHFCGFPLRRQSSVSLKPCVNELPGSTKSHILTMEGPKGLESTPPWTSSSLEQKGSRAGPRLQHR